MKRTIRVDDEEWNEWCVVARRRRYEDVSKYVRACVTQNIKKHEKAPRAEIRAIVESILDERGIGPGAVRPGPSEGKESPL